MKKRILLAVMAVFGFASNAQEVSGSVTMGPQYANQVYYKLSDQTSNSYPATSWDLAFDRTSLFSIGIRVNDHKGISVYEVSNDFGDWANVDVAEQTGWQQLYNSEGNWQGAFDQGSANYGWGEYNSSIHHVEGTVVFVLKYDATTYKKIKINDFFYGYTFTYSSWVDGAWTADTEVTLPNTANPTLLNNRYSLVDNAEVIAEPASSAWDLMFTKYTALQPDGVTMYPVTGVLRHPNIIVAENDEPETPGDPNTVVYSDSITTIGYDWKTLNSSFQYVISTDKAFYVKDTAAKTVYRLKFNTFEGASTGVITFGHEDVTALLGSEELENNVSFGVYPNPSTNKRISVVYNAPALNSDKNSVSIYSLTGAKVFEAKLSTSGFNSSEVDLSDLNTGIYVLKFHSGNYSATKKIVLQ